MLRLMKEKESINVVNDQTGCPTYAAGLAKAIMQIITHPDSYREPIVFHYANTGTATWYEFALAIKLFTKSNCTIQPITTAAFPTAAKRPQYSVLDTTKIRDIFNIDIPDWEDSLQNCLKQLK